MELWLGPGHRGSLFADADELRAAWIKHRDQVMALWGQNGHRPMGWWEFEAGDLEHPGYDNEPRFLYENGLLSADERTKLEEKWAAERRQQSRKEEPHSKTAQGSESA
jgi:hypothetical protein